MITLTLNPGAVNSKVFPVGILLVVGTTRLGCAGELLSVGAPCNCCKVPVFATEENGSSNVRSVLFCTVFEICKQVDERLHFMLYTDDTFMITSCEVVFRVTLQKTVPLGDGNVLGRYSSPLFRLKSYTVMESTSTLLHHTA